MTLEDATHLKRHEGLSAESEQTETVRFFDSLICLSRFKHYFSLSLRSIEQKNKKRAELGKFGRIRGNT
ncbi:hypothetical protein RSA42_04520 [Exiguobacterium indicum]|nr:hypothetical protein RSA42_04520 [Exiguobacterium indicum]